MCTDFVNLEKYGWTGGDEILGKRLHFRNHPHHHHIFSFGVDARSFLNITEIRMEASEDFFCYFCLLWKSRKQRTSSEIRKILKKLVQPLLKVLSIEATNERIFVIVFLMQAIWSEWSHAIER